jgi:hypothetical protein
MASFNRALLRVKSDLSTLLPDSSIEQACRAAGHRWRCRLLDPVLTVQLFVLQVLNFNTALTHLRHLACGSINPSAFCQARQRLPLAAMRTLLGQLCDSVGATGLFHGHKLWLVDGSSASTPDTLALQERFPQSRSQCPGCGFPMIKLLGLFDATTGLLMRMIPTSLHAHEQSRVSQLHPLLGAGDLLLGDRGLCSFWHVVMLMHRHVNCIFRMHQCQIVDFKQHRRTHRKGEIGRPRSRWIKRLGRRDQLVEWIKPKQQPKWMSKAQYTACPATLIVRELKYAIAHAGQRTHTVTIVTTLLDRARYSKDEIAWLYGVRWEVETHFRQLKTTMKMRVLKCKSPDGAMKELIAFAIAYNLVRMTMNQAAQRQRVDIERISFIDTLRWLISAAPGETVPDLSINPLRPDRHEPRVVKRRANSHNLMNLPRSELRKRLFQQQVVA